MQNENFIHLEFLKNKNICDELIEYFRKNEHLKCEGQVSNKNGRIINKDHKDSYDIVIEEDYFQNYFNELQTIVNNYKKIFPYCDEYAPWKIVEKVNIQQYLPGGGFKKWHTERTDGHSDASRRHLVFMTYLNDVIDEGETVFYHQRIKIPPQKGLTMIWPADWTYTHKGIPSKTQEKYIVTGWYSFV